MDVLSDGFITHDTVRGKARLSDDEMKRYSVEYGDVLFQRSSENYEDAGTSNVYLDQQFPASFGGFVIRGKRIADYDPVFIKYLLGSQAVRNQITCRAQGAQHINVSQDTLFDVFVNMPAAREQKVVGSTLLRLDSLITLHQRKYDQLAVLKKALLDKMFPRDGAFVPEIRFVGFTDPWEQRKLGDITDRYKELVPTPRDGYTRMGVRSHAKGTFLAEVEPGQQIEEQELSKVRANNLVVNIVFAWEHAVAITSEADAKALVSHRFPQFSFHDDMEPGFFRYATLDEDFRRHLWLASPSGAGRNKTLNIGTMLEYEFIVPSRREQTEIAKFFDRLDNLITLHQRKLGLLKNLKAALLDKMFV